MKHNKKAFTLIELLVVVLIIGILAAVALPQYQKAVEKSRWTEWFTVINGVERDAQLAFLEQGFPSDGSDDYDICDNFESFPQNSLVSSGTHETKHFYYSTEECNKSNIYLSTSRHGYNIYAEARFYPNGSKSFVVYGEESKLVCDMLVAAYGADIVSCE